MRNRETTGILVYSDMDNIEYESVIRHLSGRRIFVAVNDEISPQRRELLERIMTVQYNEKTMEVEGGHEEFALSAPKEEVEMEVQGRIRSLTREQAQILQSLENEDLSVLVVQASAGTGKTHISLYILKFLERRRV